MKERGERIKERARFMMGVTISHVRPNAAQEDPTSFVYYYHTSYLVSSRAEGKASQHYYLSSAEPSLI